MFLGWKSQNHICRVIVDGAKTVSSAQTMKFVCWRRFSTGRDNEETSGPFCPSNPLIHWNCRTYWRWVTTIWRPVWTFRHQQKVRVSIVASFALPCLTEATPCTLLDLLACFCVGWGSTHSSLTNSFSEFKVRPNVVCVSVCALMYLSQAFANRFVWPIFFSLDCCQRLLSTHACPVQEQIQEWAIVSKLTTMSILKNSIAKTIQQLFSGLFSFMRLCSFWGLFFCIQLFLYCLYSVVDW